MPSPLPIPLISVTQLMAVMISGPYTLRMMPTVVDVRLLNIRFVVEGTARFIMDSDLKTDQVEGQEDRSTVTPTGSVTFSPGSSGQVRSELYDEIFCRRLDGHILPAYSSVLMRCG